MTKETNINSIGSITANFRSKDKKKILKYLQKKIKDEKKKRR
jgi:hypothetical protein